MLHLTGFSGALPRLRPALPALSLALLAGLPWTPVRAEATAPLQAQPPAATETHSQPQILPVLPRLGLQRQGLTLSGISSGAYMASQFGVAYAASVAGVGMVAGGPYGCSKGSVTTASTDCSCPEPDKLGMYCRSYNPDIYLTYSDSTLNLARQDIDDTAYLKQQRVWIYRGDKDRIVNANLTEAARRFYLKHQVAADQIQTVAMPKAGHAYPSPQGHDACELTRFPYMVNCKGYDAAGELLQWLYQDLYGVQPATARPGSLKEFRQAGYAQGAEFHGLDATAWVYVPQACEKDGAQCRLHVAFHGCEQGQSFNSNGTVFGQRFVAQAGYNEWAEAARLVILYPQVKPTPEALSFDPYKFNPKGCWDFWGYTERNATTYRKFATRSAPQMKAVKAMIEELMGRRED